MGKINISLIIFSSLLALLGISVLVFYLLHISIFEILESPNETFLDDSANIGGFIGGFVGTILTFAGFIILIITLSLQRRISDIDQFENKFFQLVKLHRDNVSEISLNRSSKKEDGKLIDFNFQGRQAVKVILDEFVECRYELNNIFRKYSTADIYEREYLEEKSKIFNIEKTHIRLKSIAKIDICYCIVFYGVGEEGFSILTKLFKDRYKESFYLTLLNYIQMKPVRKSSYWEKWEELKSISNINDRLELSNEINSKRNNNKLSVSNKNLYYNNRYIKYYGGHQYRLGHYYRHLYQTVTFVDSHKYLSNQQKYFYVKTLRAQLSTYEQALLFINSLSIVGLPWEYNPRIKQSYFNFINLRRKKKKKLITKYNLIKNLAGDHILGINFIHYYPGVDYEIPRSLQLGLEE